MNMFTRQDLQEGQRKSQELSETPSSFTNPDGIERNNTRMAGTGGKFAMDLMQNPQVQQQAGDWMEMFAESNEGAQFNQAKMGIPMDGAA